MSVVIKAARTLNWKGIVACAAILFMVRLVFGVLAGFFEPTWNPERAGLAQVWFGGGFLLSFALDFAVFTCFSFCQRRRPFLHASLVLVSACVAWWLFGAAVDVLLPISSDTPLTLVLFNAASQVSALVAGTAFGCSMSAHRAVSA